jgi:hypothetical protein
MAVQKIQNPKVTAIQKVKTNAPPLPKPAKAPKAPKIATQGALSPLYGQKRPRPTIQSVPTRTPSF